MQQLMERLQAQSEAAEARFTALEMGLAGLNIPQAPQPAAAQTPAPNLAMRLVESVRAPRRLADLFGRSPGVDPPAPAPSPHHLADQQLQQLAPAPGAAALRRVQLPPPAVEPLVDDDDDEFFDALEAQLELLAAPTTQEKTLADQFGGHPLPLAHTSPRWPRDQLFQGRTCHYHPRLAGDGVNGALVDKLTELGAAQLQARAPEWGTTYAYELRTLVPAVSYLTDAQAAALEMASSVTASARAGEPLDDGLPQALVDLATQLASTRAHLIERVDVLRACGLQSDVDVEVLSRLYDSEQRVASESSQLGQAVSAMTLAGSTRKLVAKAADRMASASVGAGRLQPKGQPPTPRGGLTLGRRQTRAGAGKGRPQRGGAARADGAAGQPNQEPGQQPRAPARPAAPQQGMPRPATPPPPPEGKGGRGAQGGRGTGRGGRG